MEQVLYWLAGALGVPLINLLKRLLGLSGKAALGLTALVAAILAVLALLINQELDLAALTLENLPSVFGQVLAAATLAYKLLNS